MPVHDQANVIICLQTSKDPVIKHFHGMGADQTVVSRPGAVTVISPGPQSGVLRDGCCKGLMLALDFKRLAISGPEPRGPIELMRTLCGRDATLNYLLRAMYSELRAGCPGGRLFGEGINAAVSGVLLRRYTVWGCAREPRAQGLPAHSLQVVTGYINDNLDKDLSLVELAALTRFSPYYFGKLFKQSTGESVHQYVIGRRIEMAKRLLLNRRLTLTEVMVAAGLPNASHFTTLFRRRTGLTPAGYRDII
jgi:AraC family transcriptional regulator